MAPYIAGELSKAIKKALRGLVEYEFVTGNLVSDDEEEDKEENKHDAAPETESAANKGPRQTLSLKGIIWRELGKDTYEHWSKYYSESSNANELTLGVKLYAHLFEDAFKFIKESEFDYAKKEKVREKEKGNNKQQAQPMSKSATVSTGRKKVN